MCLVPSTFRTWYLQRPEGISQILWNWVTDGCELPFGFWELNPGCLQEQMLFTTDPSSLQALTLKSWSSCLSFSRACNTQLCHHTPLRLISEFWYIVESTWCQAPLKPLDKAPSLDPQYACFHLPMLGLWPCTQCRFANYLESLLHVLLLIFVLFWGQA